MNPSPSRREFLTAGAAGVVAATFGSAAHAIEPIIRNGKSQMRVSLAAYSFRQFLPESRRPKPKATMTLEDFIDKCAAYGCDATELTSYYWPTEITDEYIYKLKRKAFTLGLDVSSTSVGNNFCFPKGPQRDENLALTKKWCDLAQKLGAPVIRIFAGGAPQGTTREQARAWCLECIEECCDYAGKRGVLLGLENHGGIVNGVDELLDLVKAVNSPWFGVNLDTGNFRSDDPYRDLAKAAPYAVTVQVKTEVTTNGKKEEADLKRKIDLLRKANYRGYVVLEYEAAEDPLVAVPKYLNELKKLVAA